MTPAVSNSPKRHHSKVVVMFVWKVLMPPPSRPGEMGNVVVKAKPLKQSSRSIAEVLVRRPD